MIQLIREKLPGIKRLHLLVLKTFIGPFFLIFFIVLFILLMQFLWRYIDELVGKGLEFKVIAELLLYTSSSLVPMALPLSILMSSLMTFGNMGEYYELTAIKASGISLQRVMMPLFIVVILISIGAFFFANQVLPYTNLKMRSLLYDVRKQRPEISIVPGTFYNGMDGYSIRVDKRDSKTNMLYNIKIYDHTKNNGNTSVTIADSGSMVVTNGKQNLILTLYKGYSYNELQQERGNQNLKTYPHRYDKFDEQQLIIELVGFGLERTDESLFKNMYQMMRLSQLSVMEDSLETDISSNQDYLYHSLLRSSYFKRHEPIVPSAKPIDKPDTSLVSNRKYKFANVKSITHRTKANKLDTSIQKADKDGFNKSKIDVFSLLTIKEQNQVLEEALSNARSSRTFVVNSIQTVDFKQEQLRKYEIEWQRKFTISYACFMFLLIGAPLGAIIRKGGLGFPLVISTLSFIFYYIISLFGEKMVRESIVTDYQGMWMTPVFFTIIGIFLTYKATTDATILNLDTYTNFLKKIFGKRKIMLVDTLKMDKYSDMQKQLRKDNLVASLTSLLETINDNIETVNKRRKPADFIASLVEMEGNSDIILFERLYKNIVREIMNSELNEDRAIRNLLSSFPDFISKNYTDLGLRFTIRLILLFLPPFTLIIIIRQYFLLHMLKGRLKTIYDCTEDMVHLLKSNQ
jgi:lipopolysaccharide export system permease protein